MHCLTTREDVELRIEVGNETTPSIVWTYQLFQVGGAETNWAKGQVVQIEWPITMGVPLPHETVTMMPTVVIVLLHMVEHGGTTIAGIPI